MGMPVEFQTMIVTKGKEVRQEGNLFELTKDGYRIYPLNIPIEVKRTKEGEVAGVGVVVRQTWEEDATTIQYELKALNSTN
ncbi:DUF2584 family protein [Mangrovibacillus cuniculi]|uniref:DUF2584 family protein n=1 Tax=Mangrovibacillus cuniculi TaxID=2593652 RepID=A0A7S8HG11_9BACI|nr:DUF2584 family protein [Mangrovibacillus cuniculi]QPC47302.1 DUF2584 family protein [Mangrovibacillus cuniculi]